MVLRAAYFQLLRCLKPPLPMSKISQSAHQATSGKETDSLADASGALPPLRRAGSAATSSSVSKAPKAKGSELSTTRERNLRCAAHTCFELRHCGCNSSLELSALLGRRIQQSPNAHLLETFHGGSFVHFMDKVSRYPQDSRVCGVSAPTSERAGGRVTMCLMRAQAAPIRTTAGGTLFYRRQVNDYARGVPWEMRRVARWTPSMRSLAAPSALA